VPGDDKRLRRHHSRYYLGGWQDPSFVGMTKGRVCVVSWHYLGAGRDHSCLGMTKGKGVRVADGLLVRFIDRFVPRNDGHEVS
jgi:hypothetical protein